MAEKVMHEVTDQLENLSAQSPVAHHAAQLPAAQPGVTGINLQAFELNAPKAVDEAVATPAPSDLTELEISPMQDSACLAPPSQMPALDTHFIDSAAPRIGYQVSPTGLVTISEKPPHVTKPVSQYQPTPPLGFFSFDRYLAESSTPKLPVAQTTQLNPPSLAVERIMGPKQPIPGFVLSILEDWHAANPHTEHPAALASRAQSTWKNFKVFNDDAEEYELSMFQISLKAQKKRTLTYRIMIIHAQNGVEELVVYGQPHPRLKGKICKGTKGIYLLDWCEVEKKGEVRACAIKLWRNDNDKITYSAQIADSGRKCTPVSGPASHVNVVDSASTPKEVQAFDDGYEVDSSSSGEPLADKFRRRLLGINLKSPEYRKDRSMYYKSPLSRMGTVLPDPPATGNKPSRVLGSPWQPYGKRRRSEYFEPNNAHKVIAPVRYKFVCDTSAQVRIFKTDDAKILFRKAREFYNGTDKPMRLLCTVPGVDGVRYLGEGCIDEFDILQEDICKALGKNYEDSVVEVKAFEGL